MYVKCVSLIKISCSSLNQQILVETARLRLCKIDAIILITLYYTFCLRLYVEMKLKETKRWQNFKLSFPHWIRLQPRKETRCWRRSWRNFRMARNNILPSLVSWQTKSLRRECTNLPCLYSLVKLFTLLYV